MIKAKKKFGQNFLIDENILHKITESIPTTNAEIIEIGAGLGDLTACLLRLGKTSSYEIDEELYDFLSTKFAKEISDKKLELILGDVLDLWQENLRENKYFLIANLPYYVATNIILKAFDDKNCTGMIVMVQREVAQKFCAECGDSDFGAISVIAGLFGEREILFDVPPIAFNPPPKIVSAVMRIVKNKNEIFTSSKDYTKFKDFLRVAFVAPRKTLFKNLSSLYDKNLVKSAFNELEISQNLRSHQINIALFVKIFNFIKARNERKQ